MSEPKWLTEARRYIGEREIKGPQHNPLIVQMWKDIKRGGIKDDETPWCAAFVSSVLERGGIKSTRFESAGSYLGWGRSCCSLLSGVLPCLVKGAQEAAAAAQADATAANADADAVAAAGSALQVLAAMNVSVNGISPDESRNIQTYSCGKTLSSGVQAYTAVVENIDTEMVSMIANASFASSLTVDLSNFGKASPIYRVRLAISVREQYAPDGLTLIFTGVSKIWNDSGEAPSEVVYKNDLTVIDVWRTDSSTIPIVQTIYKSAS